MMWLARPLLNQILHHLQTVYPQEGCGLVAGLNNQATAIYPIDNILQSETAYEMEPLQQVKTMLAIEARGEDLCAIYHSHPHSPAFPSETDIALAYYPETVYLIISLQERDVPVVRGFLIVDGLVEEIEIVGE
jgi:proteasome lid subunit RPN8/RPN11